MEYEAIPNAFDESSVRDEDPQTLARLLSEAKARCIGETHPEAVVVAADLFVVYEGRIYEKPRDASHAAKMLRELSGQRFDIVTGLAVYSNYRVL